MSDINSKYARDLYRVSRVIRLNRLTGHRHAYAHALAEKHAVRADRDYVRQQIRGAA